MDQEFRIRMHVLPGEVGFRSTQTQP
uniref:Uncharacterized protein n=1 Tax=Nelumbo nucifera TaxID=4432 RepID=A0A822Y7S8_NELNU|nr:TPA_asm: hypothetical protein HUJ06_031552 [Nelumbo nucifera]